MQRTHGVIKAEFPIFAAMDKETTMLNLFRFEMRKTRLQFKRVADDLGERKARSESTESQDEFANSQAKLFADIHFLLSCLNRLGLVFFKMRSYFPEDVKLSEIDARFHEHLDSWGALRNDLEHVEDRPGKGVSILGSTFGSVFQFDEKQIDVGDQLRAEVEAFFIDVDSAYNQILIAKRKASGQKIVLFRTGIKIPGEPGKSPMHYEEDSSDR